MSDRLRVVVSIELLCDTPAAGSALKGEFDGLRRLRVGNYRVVYESQRCDLVILVSRIHRGDPGCAPSKRPTFKQKGLHPQIGIQHPHSWPEVVGFLGLGILG